MRTTEKNAGRHKPGSDRETRFILRGILLVLLGGGVESHSCFSVK